MGVALLGWFGMVRHGGQNGISSSAVAS
jgi:hypothetical protein